MRTPKLIVSALIDLTAELNRRAANLPPFTPRSAFTLSLQFPGPRSSEGVEAAFVEMKIVYESGGSEESSYVIEDSTEFLLNSESATGLVFSEEGLRSEPTSIDLNDGGTSLLRRIGGFCGKRLETAPEIPLD